MRHFYAVNASFVCEEGSVPSICPGGGDDSPYLGCFPNDSFCNLASDCPGGIDEANCTDYGEEMCYAYLVELLLGYDLISGEDNAHTV